MRFKATVEQSGKTATGIQVPEDAVASRGSSKRPAVRVTIGGYTYRSTIAVMGGRFMLPISAEVRAGSGVKAGDEIDVEVALDTQPREVEIPEDFRAQLEQEPEAKRFFDSLSYSNRLRFVLGIEDAKTADTRQRRIDGAITKLREGRAL
jgi:hypothetical protein